MCSVRLACCDVIGQLRWSRMYEGASLIQVERGRRCGKQTRCLFPGYQFVFCVRWNFRGQHHALHQEESLPTGMRLRFRDNGCKTFAVSSIFRTWSGPCRRGSTACRRPKRSSCCPRALLRTGNAPSWIPCRSIGCSCKSIGLNPNEIRGRTHYFKADSSTVRVYHRDARTKFGDNWRHSFASSGTHE